jgi:hypothetical protein
MVMEELNARQVQNWKKINELLTLPVFNPDAICSKCGHDKIGCQWKNRSDLNRGYAPADEWLSRRCDRCGYIWDEACIAGDSA